MSTDEEVLESSPRRLPRRAWLALAVAAIVALAVAFVLTRGDDDKSRAAPARSTSATPTPTPSSTVVSVPRTVCLDVGDSALNCGVSANLPRPTLLATRTVLPNAVVVSATTVTGRDGKVFSRRVIVQGARGSTLRLRVGPIGSRSDENVNGINDGLAVEYGTTVARRRIELSVRVAPGIPVPPVAALHKLAVDPRLLAVS